MTLLVIILFLLVAIIGIIGLPIDKVQEVKVNKEQLPTFVEAHNVEIVWDVSGSMWGKVAEDRKYLRSKKVLIDIIESIPSNVNVGLRIFGAKNSKHKTTNLNVKATTNNRNKLLEKVKQLNPAGKSPIGKALIEASRDLVNLEGNNHILLVTDGKDTGNIMPGRVANRLRGQGIRVHILYVGNPQEKVEINLKSIAQLGGGKYFVYSEKDKVVPTMNLQVE